MKVLIDIMTPTSFFPAGTTVTEADLDGPMSAADWRRLGHLEPEQAQAATKPAKGPTAPAVAPTDAALSD